MRLALAGGGTGGHLVPGLHLLEHLRESSALPEDVLWFSSGRDVEERVLANLPQRIGTLAIERVRLALEPTGSSPPSWLRLVARTAPETRRARRSLVSHGSEVLLALGGYASLPAVLAARGSGIPVVLLELNSVPGKATRALAGLSERVVHAWPTPLARAGTRHRWLGPPLAPAFTRELPSEAESARLRVALGFRGEAPLLLVLGGSQGADGLNRFLRSHARSLAFRGLQVLHQTGPGRRAEAAGESEGYRAVEYLDDVATALDAATLVLCRGGASTLAEVAARARAALVVPYPHHRDRHQEHNALALGAGVRIVPEERLDAALAETLAALAGADGARERAAMARALTQALPKDGCERLAAELLLAAQRYRTTSQSAANPQAQLQ